MFLQLQVVVLEKGRFTPAAELTLRERDSSKEMYEMGTLLTTQDAGAFMRAPVKVLHLYSWLCSLSSNLIPDRVLQADTLITPGAGVDAVPCSAPLHVAEPTISRDIEKHLADKDVPKCRQPLFSPAPGPSALHGA